MKELMKAYYDQLGLDFRNFQRVTVTEDDMQKLVEMVVRECIQIGGPEDSYTDEWFKAKADSVNKIKQHFGIKE